MTINSKKLFFIVVINLLIFSIIEGAVRISLFMLDFPTTQPGVAKFSEQRTRYQYLTGYYNFPFKEKINVDEKTYHSNEVKRFIMPGTDRYGFSLDSSEEKMRDLTKKKIMRISNIYAWWQYR